MQPYVIKMFIFIFCRQGLNIYTSCNHISVYNTKNHELSTFHLNFYEPRHCPHASQIVLKITNLKNSYEPQNIDINPYKLHPITIH